MTERDAEPPAPALDPDASVAVECLNCGRSSVLRPDGEAAGLPLVQLTRRLRCSDCGSRAVRAARVDVPRDVARQIRSRMRSRQP